MEAHALQTHRESASEDSGQTGACGLSGYTCQNVGSTERLISVAAGSALLAGGLRRIDSLGGVALALIGGSLVYRGASGHCSMYQALGIDTAHHNPATAVPAGHGEKVEHATLINCPPERVYAFWRRLENLPQFMSHLESVKVLDDKRSHWVAKGPMGVNVAWDAETYNERPNEMIAWRSLPGSQVDTAGSVHFKAVRSGQATEVRVSLKYDPPAGSVGIAIAKLFGESPEQQITEDLRRLKQLLEAGEIATTQGQSSGRATEPKGRRLSPNAAIDEAGSESFPASDPPAWTSTTTG